MLIISFLYSSSLLPSINARIPATIAVPKPNIAKPVAVSVNTLYKILDIFPLHDILALCCA